MATTKQKKAVQKIIENHGNVSKSMREVGYTHNTAKKPTNLTESKGFKEASKPFVDQMIAERKRLINSMKTKNLDKVKYRDHTDSVDKLTKNIQLLSGEETERTVENIRVEFV